jgi:hypothetical protein
MQVWNVQNNIQVPIYHTPFTVVNVFIKRFIKFYFLFYQPKRLPGFTGVQCQISTHIAVANHVNDEYTG